MRARPNDGELVRLARRGDRRAFAALVTGHYPVLLATCRRVLRDGELARDAAQQTILTAMLGLEHLRDEERFESWLIGIGLNVSRAVLRERSRSMPSAATLAREQRLADSEAAPTDPAQSVEHDEVVARVRNAIKHLPPGQRDAVALYYIAGLTLSEIAEHLGTVPGAIKTRLHKARRSLRAPLTQLWKENFMSADKLDFVRMEVADLRRSAATGPQPDPIRNILFLDEEGGDRRLSIWVGASEATALAVLLEDVQLPRPWTHQFAAQLLRAAGGQLAEVRIVELTDFTFYAQVVLADGTTVDARPSDALALALHLDAPIYVADRVLEQAASRTAADRSSLGEAHHSREGIRAIADEARSRLKAQAEMLEDLRR